MKPRIPWVPPLMPPSGMVTTSIKLCTMVLQVTSMSPSAPPVRCKMAFMAIIITLSTATMRKGVKPITSTRPITRTS